MVIQQTVSRPKRQGGFSLVELIITLAIIAPLLIYVAHEYIEQNTARFQSIAADQMSQYANGLNTYVTANNATLATCASTTVACPVTLAQLQAANDLPNTFSATNVYGQGYASAVLKDTAGNLLPLAVTTGGTTIPDNDVRTIAAKITQDGAEGGYVSVQNATVAQGAYGSWGNGVTVATWGLAPGGGHLADAVFVRDAAITDDYLHRHATAGEPQLNQMDTAIDMNGNALNNVSAVNAEAGNAINIAGSKIYGDSNNLALRAASGNVYIQNAAGTGAGNIASVGNIAGTGTFSAAALSATGNVTAGGNVLATGNVYGAQGVYTENVYAGSNTAGAADGYSSNFFSGGTGGWENTTYGGGWFMQDTTWIRAYGNKSVYTAGEIEGGTVQSTGRMTTGEYLQINGVATAGAGCSPNGLVGRDSTGALLACTSGLWADMSSNGAYHYVGQTLNQDYSGSNHSGHTMFVLVSSQGDACGTTNNAFGSIGYVNGSQVATNIDWNQTYYKSLSMTFPVPNGSTFEVTYSNFQCNTLSTIWEYY